MFKKILALVLALIIAALALTSCNSKNEEPAPTDAPATETEASKNDEGKILLSGENRYRIVYPENSKELKTYAMKIYEKLLALDPIAATKPVYYNLGTDKAVADGTPEILVGLTNRDASAKAAETLTKYHDYAIHITDGCIAIYANTEERLDAAVTYFIKNMSATDNGDVYYKKADSYVNVYKGDYPSAKIEKTPLKDYRIVISSTADETQKQAADQLALSLSKMCGSNIQIVTDAEAATEHEILLCPLNRPESESPSGVNDRISLKNGKIVMVPSNNGYARLSNTLCYIINEMRGAVSGKDIEFSSLSYDVIRSVSFGAVNITEQTNGLRFNKFSDKQIEKWTEYNRYNEAASSTGIRLDFYTDSSSFYFKASQNTKFELFINGESKEITSKGTFDVTLEGENRITVLFPNHQVNTTLFEVTLDEGATIKPYEYQRKFLIVGDSITQGYSAATDSLSWANRITRMFDADSVIQAISGGTFQVSTLDPEVDFIPDYIFVAYGTNDWGARSSMDDFKAYAQAYYDKLAELYPDAKIIGITPIWRKDTEPRRVGEFDDMCAALKEIIESVGGYAVNGVDLVPHDRQYYGEDICLHPNNEGFEFYANNLYEAVKDIIK